MILKKVLAEEGSVVIPSYPEGSGFKFENANVGTILSGLLPYIYVVAGLVLLILLIAGGFQLMTSAGNPDSIKAGSGRIKAALIGFLIIFLSYFIMTAVEVILKVDIL